MMRLRINDLGGGSYKMMISGHRGVRRALMVRVLATLVALNVAAAYSCLPYSTGHKLGVLLPASAFQCSFPVVSRRAQGLIYSSPPRVRVGPLPSNSLDGEVGGYTTRQRLREEIESPFRKVRLLFFGSTTGSALTALYFSAINAIKAASLDPGSVEATTGMTAFGTPAVSLEEALSACAINLTGAVVCAFLTLREYRVGQANLERIKRGGQLARLSVLPAASASSLGSAPPRTRLRTLKDYRRSSRVVIAAGGPEYVSTMSRQLASDPSQGLVDAMEGSDLVVVPVLLQQRNDDSVFVSTDTQEAWYNAIRPDGADSTINSGCVTDPVVAFPVESTAWSSYLGSEIATAQSQGYNVVDKGITIIVKKNGRILRRATGLPNWSDLVSRMEVMDGSKFGMPGDDERYGKR